jgi:hypothetical protein
MTTKLTKKLTTSPQRTQRCLSIRGRPRPRIKVSVGLRDEPAYFDNRGRRPLLQ